MKKLTVGKYWDTEAEVIIDIHEIKGDEALVTVHGYVNSMWFPIKAIESDGRIITYACKTTQALFSIENEE